MLTIYLRASFKLRARTENHYRKGVGSIKRSAFEVEVIEEVDSGEKLSTIKIRQADFSVELFSYGASLTELCFPDRAGRLENVVLNFSEKQSYLATRSFLGASVGRCAGRIAGGKYLLFDQELQLEKNEGENHLHGGSEGFDTVCWSHEIIERAETVTVIFSHIFKDGESGYPGNLVMKISYTIYSDKRIKISYWGKADKDTLLNPTNHTYFNLSGGADKTVNQHYLSLCSDRFVSLDQSHIPVYPSIESAGTVFDSRKPLQLRRVFESKNHQIVQEKGLNHPFFLKQGSERVDAPIELSHPTSGRKLCVQTTSSCVVCYTGNHFETGGEPAFHGGIALETQELYGVKNGREDEQRICLKKGRIYSSWTEWTFGLLEDSV